MTRPLISKHTRNEFREFLVGWTLREIRDAFDAAEIRPDLSHAPQLGGERRDFVEQHYHSLDFRQKTDVNRLLAAFGRILQRAEREMNTAPDTGAATRAFESLKECLAEDQFEYRNGAIVGATPHARAILEEDRTISEFTRRALFDEIMLSGAPWWGCLAETDFLNRLYDLEKLPSYDSRFPTMFGDVWQHRVNNFDWDEDWVFSEPRLALLDGPDEVLLRFLCEMVHPRVRPNPSDSRELVSMFNRHLALDAWELVEARVISGRPLYAARRIAGHAVALPTAPHATNVLSDEYVRELAAKCDTRLASGDLEGAITVGRTLLEAVLGELEIRLAGAKGEYKGDLPKQFKSVAKLLRMDDQRSDLDDRFKDVVRGLVTLVSGLAPLRNKMSDGHARVRKPALHHARLVVNASKTVSGFLIESYHCQESKGLLAGAPKMTGGLP